MNFDSPEKSMRILLVDDNEITSQQLIKYIKNKDYDVTATNNIKNAINIIYLEKKFDLILLNMIDSESDAFQTIESFEKSGQILRQNIIQFMSSPFTKQEIDEIGNPIDEMK